MPWPPQPAKVDPDTVTVSVPVEPCVERQFAEVLNEAPLRMTEVVPAPAVIRRPSLMRWKIVLPAFTDAPADTSRPPHVALPVVGPVKVTVCPSTDCTTRVPSTKTSTRVVPPLRITESVAAAVTTTPGRIVNVEPAGIVVSPFKVTF
ncbi:MAG: hypothetical protein MUC96_17060 [Myxococcaceae bacterium]|nr:hypothetical protein [Myxococcaceae bacterium]